MKCISLWQPYASLWLTPSKIHETRHWALKHRGPLAVHAAKRMEKTVNGNLETILRGQFGSKWRETLPTGSIIGIVHIIDCRPTDEVYYPRSNRHQVDDFYCGNFAPGRFAWKRGEFELFTTPIPFIGRQNIFSVPDDIAARGTISAANHAEARA